MSENLADFYFQKLYTEKNVGLLLARFYCEAFDLQINKSIIITFNKLLKMYGRETIFFSIMDMYDMENINHDKIYPLITYLCKRRMEKKYGNEFSTNIDLTSYINNTNKRINEQYQKNILLGSLND
jgi:hypothetical protein